MTARATGGGRASRGRARGSAAASGETGVEPWERKIGVESLVEAVRDLEFPKTLKEIVDEVGTREVRTSKETQFPLAYVALKLNEPEFDSLDDFETAVLRHWRGIESLEIPADQRPGSHLR